MPLNPYLSRDQILEQARNKIAGMRTNLLNRTFNPQPANILSGRQENQFIPQKPMNNSPLLSGGYPEQSHTIPMVQGQQGASTTGINPPMPQYMQSQQYYDYMKQPVEAGYGYYQQQQQAYPQQNYSQLPGYGYYQQQQQAYPQQNYSQLPGYGYYQQQQQAYPQQNYSQLPGYGYYQQQQQAYPQQNYYGNYNLSW